MKQKLLFLFVLVLLSIPMGSIIAQATTVPQVVDLPEQIAGGRDVTITVSDKPASDQPEELELWENQTAKFEAMYPNVTIEGLEVTYDPTAFHRHDRR